MNRLVIVGNGFDLANGLKSRYEDFLVYYLKQRLDRFFQNGKFSDLLMTIKFDFENRRHHFNYLDFDKIIDFHNCSSLKIGGFGFKPHSHVTIAFASDLFRELFSSQNWTDIEYSYFNLLRRFSPNPDRVKKLNREFEFLKDEFERYLIQESENFALSEKMQFPLEMALSAGPRIANYYMNNSIQRLKNELASDPSHEKIYFLNFNYTSILSNALNTFLQDFLNLGLRPTVVSHIHGSIYDEGQLVFGYGDEMIKDFKEFQEKNDFELLKHFKSYYYASNDEYLNLLNFINSVSFDVVVIGHSLGLSDRVLLNTIFEHDNCKAIHLFHRGEDSHFRLRLALGRHFNDSANYRAKLMTYNPRFHLNT